MSIASVHVVIDTNVFVTALLRGAASLRVYEAFLRGDFIPLFSHPTLTELMTVLRRPALRALTSETEVNQLLTLIQQDGVIVRPTETIHLCRDPKDNIFLECAVAGRADYLITGDLDLLTLHPFRGIRIVRPTEFLRRLE